MIQFTPIKQHQACQLVAYPGYGYQTATGTWKLRISGVVVEYPDEYSFRKRMLVKMLGNVMKVTPEQLDCHLFKTRIAPFLADTKKQQQINLRVGDYDVPLKKKTKSNGQFKTWVSISDHDVSRIGERDENGLRHIPVRLSCESTHGAPTDAKIFLQKKAGISVISDVDDTIKISSVGDRQELLANTFLREFESVAGMSEVYRAWHKNGASFHYVSSSPWQLYDALKSMKFEEGFPEGTVHLQNFQLHDQLLRKMRLRRQGKSKAIRSLLKDMPHRRFVLVGDSGEKDPEIYHKLCRKYPGRIKGLFIRELDHRPLSDKRLEKLNDTLFDGVAAKFHTPQELASLSGSLFHK